MILHDWDDNNAIRILEKCREAVAGKGMLLIVEKIIDEENTNELVCLSDINMLVTLPGKERSLSEFIALLNQTGFQYKRKTKTDTIFSIIEAIPV